MQMQRNALHVVTPSKSEPVESHLEACRLSLEEPIVASPHGLTSDSQ